ncbi:glutathione S-transferase N-terminal domain-containing protein [Hyphomonas sp.]|uniref:glutathione S-transferase family protein n=1 Tax=Hyphomonas sp. TaxID=87 RepID=UPI0032EFE9EE
MAAGISEFPVSQRWPVKHPDRIQLYSFPTPNGVKVSIMLEETGLPYEPHLVPLTEESVKSQEFVSLNPNGKIPAILDPDGPDGRPIAVFESGAILQYLAEKSQSLFGQTQSDRASVLQWLMFQMGGVGPIFGQVGFFFAYAGKEIQDPRPGERYLNEAKRLLGVVDTQLQGRDWIAGDYSIADIALAPWLGTLEYYGVHDAIGWDEYSNVHAYLARFLERPAVQRGVGIPNPAS